MYTVQFLSFVDYKSQRTTMEYSPFINVWVQHNGVSLQEEKPSGGSQEKNVIDIHLLLWIF